MPTAPSPALIINFAKAKIALEDQELTQRWAFVSIVNKILYLFDNEQLIKKYSCSTSLKPPSNQYGGFGTPLGLHRIAQKIGEGQPEGMIFEKREAIGRIFGEGNSDKGLITSRILWLEGLEEGKNLGYESGSHNRKIYIHGTNQEDKIGQPKSHGCVELTNGDVIELFNQLNENDLVLID